MDIPHHKIEYLKSKLIASESDEGDAVSFDGYNIKLGSDEQRAVLVALAKKLQAVENRIANLSQQQKKNRQAVLQAFPFENLPLEDVEKILDAWRKETGHHSSGYWIQHGRAFEDVLRIPTRCLVQSLLQRLKGGDVWIGYQKLLQRLTGENNIGSWEEEKLGWRAYNVSDSAKLWIEWGIKHELLEN